MKNVYLIGMMGSGKTKTGASLALLLNYEFVDLDDLIEQKNGCSINEIFSSRGESFFRESEHVVLTETSKRESCVVATGGGIVVTPVNLELMKASGHVVYLKGKLDTLWNRVKKSKTRPLLKTESPRESFEKVFRTRQPLYESIADFTIETDGLGPNETAVAILKILEQS